MYALYLSSDGEFAAEDADGAFAVEYSSSERSDGLVADEEDGVLGVFDVVYEVVLYPAAGAHAGACDDDDGAFCFVYRL